jgi:hypothetical protein
MKIKIINIFSIVNYVLLLLAMSSASIYAQKPTALDKAKAYQQRSFEIERKACEELNQSALALLLLDLIKANDSTWRLEKATYSAKRGGGDSSGMELVYKKRNLLVAFVIYEYETLNSANEAAKDVSKIGRSAGKAVKYNRFGTSGEKIYGDGGIFWMLTFSLDKFRVLVVSRKEKNAEHFAAFIERAIEELPDRSELKKQSQKRPTMN